MLRLQNPCHSAIRILIIGEECELGVHEVHDKVYGGRRALGELDAHGIAAGAAAAGSPIAGYSHGTVGDEIEDRHAILELENVRCSIQAQTGDGNLPEQVFFILNRERTAVLDAQPTPVECIGSRNIAA